MATNYQLFLYTVDEYKRFAKHLIIKRTDSLTDTYDEADYVGIQVRLMLLRKYFHNNGNVSMTNLLSDAQRDFPGNEQEFHRISSMLEMISSQHLQHILADGTKQTLYDTIEDTIYGLYLHADENRILRLMNANESMRFICIRKFVIDFENVIFEFSKALKNCNVIADLPSNVNRATVVYYGDPSDNSQEIKGSAYWSNVYGRDATEEDLKSIIDHLSDEDKQIIITCLYFMQEVRKRPISVKKLRKYVFPPARSHWGDFSKMQALIDEIPSPGISTKVRYDTKRRNAYLRVYPKVNGAFTLSTPHVLDDGYAFSLSKWFGKWRIVSFLNPSRR